MSPTHLEQEIIRVAEEYRDLGYQVTIAPQAKDLPDFLADTSPDLLAISGSENVLIEVKRASDLRGSQDLADFAKRVANRTEWRFELVTIVSSDNGDGRPTPEQYWSQSKISEFLSEAEKLAAASHYDAALLIAYAATEAALFAWATSAVGSEPNVIASLRSPRMIIRQMAIAGDIDQHDFSRFLKLEEFRNALAHGAASRRASQRDVDALLRLAATVTSISREQRSPLA